MSTVTLREYREQQIDLDIQASDHEIVSEYMEYAESLSGIIDELDGEELPALRAQLSALEQEISEISDDPAYYNERVAEAEATRQQLAFMQTARDAAQAQLLN